MWEVFYDKWSEAWIVLEFSREVEEKFDDRGRSLTYYWREDAERSAIARNTNNKKSGEEYDQGDVEFGDADTFWPGGSVRYGVSYG